MSHEAKTRRMANAGKKTGVLGRKSRLDKRGKPGALGEAGRRHYVGGQTHPPPEAVRNTEQFWNNLSHEWFGTNPRSFPYNMGKWDGPVSSPPIKRTEISNQNTRRLTPIKMSEIQGGWPEYVEAVEQQDQRDKHAWPSRNDQALLPKEEPKEKMGDGGRVWPKYARAQDRVIKGHRGRDIKRYAKSLVTKQSHR